MEFMCTCCQGRYAKIVEVNWNPANGLYSVGMNWNATFGRQARQAHRPAEWPPSRYWRASAWQTVYHREMPRPFCAASARPMAIDGYSIDGETGCFKPGDRFGDCRMLDRA